jgi:hypothetical protein
MKTNLWRESKNHLIPAAGLEVYLQTEFGSPALRSGLQPSLSLLFDQTLPFGVNFEWNVGVNGAQKPFTLKHNLPNGPINDYHGPEQEALEFNAQWALQRRFFKKLDIFVHGFINGAAIPNLADGVEIGGGGGLQGERPALLLRQLQRRCDDRCGYNVLHSRIRHRALIPRAPRVGFVMLNIVNTARR